MAHCKEYTEYSEEELAQLLSTSCQIAGGTSDDFLAKVNASDCPCLPAFAAKFAKEHTEYSEAELAALQQEPPRAAAAADRCAGARASSDDFAGEAYTAPAPQGLAAVDAAAATAAAAAAAAPASVPWSKEYTEFSAQELEAVLQPRAPGGCCGASLGAEGSDGFSLEAARPPGGCTATKPLCKELTEYSTRELSALAATAEGKVPAELTSDDFTDCTEGKAKSFFAWYASHCSEAVPTGGSVQRARRVYHNRRKTAWTDYDESGAVAGSSSGAQAEEEAAPMSELVEWLKAAPIGGPSRDEVRSAVLSEARLGAGGDAEAAALAAALRRGGACGWPPLLVAVQRKQPQAVEELLRLGADVEGSEPKMGWTPLMYGAASGNVAIVRSLLAGRASVNAVAVRQNWTPLCSAIQSGKADVVRLLVERGADIKPVKKHHPMLAQSYMEEFQPAA